MKNTTLSTTIGSSILSFRQRKAPKALMFKENSRWQSKSWPEYYDDIESLGCGLLSLGVQPGERVAIMADTRYEWSVSDLAIIGIHGVTVSIYQNNTSEDVEFILNNSESTVLILENHHLLDQWQQVQERCPSVKAVVLMRTNGQPAPEGVQTWQDLMNEGKSYRQKHSHAYEKLCASLRLEDMATLLYTSGTTGTPKGVVMTHTQIISEVSEAFPIFGVDDQDLSLSFLPYAHVLGRIEHWGHAYNGYTMAYAESIERVRNNLAEIRPTFLISVPRIFEKVYTAISAQVESTPLKKKLFRWALGVGKQVTNLKLTHQIIPLELLATYELAKKLVLNRVSDAFGGRLRFCFSGGAPLSEDVSRFFHAAGVLILQGYGLTETTAAITVNTPYNYRFDAVGRPIGEVELRIAEDGEILVRSQKVMKEYYQNPEANKESFTDRWFHTGDIGEILQGGDLRITDRKKDLIKTAGGKYVAPQKLEGLLKLSPLISQALICGDQKKYIVALLTLDPIYLQQLARDRQESFNDWTELLKRTWVQDMVRTTMANTNAQLASYESIKRFLVLPVEFTIAGGELTPSLKLKRKVLTQRYQKEIDSLYN